MSPAEAARALGVSVQTIHNYYAAGKLTGYKHPHTGRLDLEPEAVERLKAGTAATTLVDTLLLLWRETVNKNEWRLGIDVYDLLHALSDCKAVQDYREVLETLKRIRQQAHLEATLQVITTAIELLEKIIKCR